AVLSTSRVSLSSNRKALLSTTWVSKAASLSSPVQEPSVWSGWYPPEIDHAISDLGDDAGRWFLVAEIAKPWVLERRADVVLHHCRHGYNSPLLKQTANAATLTEPCLCER